MKRDHRELLGLLTVKDKGITCHGTEPSLIINELPDGRYAITKKDWEESQIAWAESVKEAHRLGREEGLKTALAICDLRATKHDTDDEAVNEPGLCAILINNEIEKVKHDN
ncbi:MAG: hypothetical protein NUV80_02700 [Candidatus Berkelbacteria bacterium]|nr:hypothetical protein [Candidatus Berkelbacteria bacterium]